MTRLLLKLAVPMLVGFTILVLLARVLGAFQPPNLALRGFSEGCLGIRQACWYGILPGVTTLDEATSIVKRYGFQYQYDASKSAIIISERNILQDACPVWELRTWDGIKVASISADRCGHLTIGDIASVIGTPDSFGSCIDYIVPTYYRSLQFEVDLTHKSFGWLSPYDHIGKIILAKPLNSDYLIWRKQWLGFAPQWRYDQALPEQIGRLCP